MTPPTGSDESLLAYGFEKFLIVTFTVAYERSEEVNLVFLVVGENQLEYLFLCIFHHTFAGLVTVGFSRPCKEQTEEVVDFGYGADRRTRILVRSFLFDADDRTQSCNFVDIGAFQVV